LALSDSSTALAGPSAATLALAGYALLRVAVYALFAGFVVIRRPSRRPSREPVAFVSCALAMASVALLHAPETASHAGTVLAADFVMLSATAWMVVCILALGRCFGILPEARGLVTRGPYRLVRHPLYLGELAAAFGLLLAQPELWNLAAMTVFVGAQAVRMPLEERALRREFDEYAAYAARTPALTPWPRAWPLPSAWRTPQRAG
jgi:protein-S-isoprenylcysteine O-methyltransferase Ste14